MKKIIILILVSLLVIPLVIASWDWDNVKDFEKTKDMPYGKITITNALGLGDMIAKYELLENTDFCISKCHAEGITTLYKREELFSGLKFEKDNSSIYLKSYNISIKKGGKWKAYNYEELDAGTYEWRIDGRKNFYDTIDWIASGLGHSFDEWALWEGLELYFPMNENTGTDIFEKIGDEDATLGGGITWATDELGNPAVSIGEDETIEQKDATTKMNMTINNNYTIAFRMNVSEDTGLVTTLLSYNSSADFILRVYNTAGAGGKVFHVMDSGRNLNYTIAEDEWHTYVFRFGLGEGGDDNVSLHVDGVYNDTIFKLGFDGSANDRIKFSEDAGLQSFIGQFNGWSFWNRSLSDIEIVEWNESISDTDSTWYISQEFSVSLILPADKSIHTGNVSFGATLNPPASGFSLINSTLLIYKDGSIINSTTNSITGIISNTTWWNVSGFGIGDYEWNVQGCGNETSGSHNCTLATSNYTFGISSIVSDAMNSTTTPIYETDMIDFRINITSANGLTPTSNFLIYDNTEYSAVATLISGINFTLNRTISVPTVAGITNKTFYFEWKNDGIGENSSLLNQTVDDILLNLCNSTLSITYVNYTFKDEIDLTNINSTFLTDWDYTLGDGTVNETLDFQNTSENHAYNFCFTPTDRTITVAGTNQFSGADYPSRIRTFSNFWTNNTLNKTLYLLNTADGIFAHFQISDSVNGTSINNVDVTVERDISGTTETLAKDSSDDAGVVIFFLSPDFIHTFTFIKEGYDILIRDITPTSADIFKVTMQPTEVAPPAGWNVTEVFDELAMFFAPIGQFLLNDTNYEFIFQVNNTIEMTVSMELENSSSSLGTVSDVGTELTLTLTNNTNGYSRITGKYLIITANETFGFTRTWSIAAYETGDFSLWAWLKEWDIQSGGQTIFQWLKILIVAIVLMGGFYVYHTQSGTDTFDSAIIPIFGGIIILWIFSLAGWLTVSYFPEFIGYQGWLNKHGIATLISLFGVGFLGWRFTSQ